MRKCTSWREIASFMMSTSGDSAGKQSSYLPLRSAPLHNLQRAFYDNIGANANLKRARINERQPEPGPRWAIPNWITSNAWIADAYATLILHAWRDCLVAGLIDASQPLFVLDIGAGDGTLAVLVIAAMRERAPRLLCVNGKPAPRWRYILTDFTPSMFHLWAHQVAIARAMDDGLCDFAVFDAVGGGEEPVCMRLAHSGEMLQAGAFVNPALVLCNYVFDSLPLDGWRVSRNEREEVAVLTELLVGLPADASDSAENSLCNDLAWMMGRTVHQMPCIAGGNILPSSTPAYYGPPDMNERVAEQCNNVLGWYTLHALHARLDEAGIAHESCLPGCPLPSHEDACTLPDSSTFTLPVGALQCMDRLRTMCSPGGAVLLICDKGFGIPGAFVGAGPPEVHLHGSFSCMVNFHALHVWAHLLAEEGVQVLPCPDDDIHVKLEMMILPPLPGLRDVTRPCLDVSRIPSAVDAFAGISRFGPSDMWDVHRVFAGKERREADRSNKGNILDPSTAGIDGQEDSSSGGEYEDEAATQAEVGTESDQRRHRRVHIPARSAVALCRLSGWDEDVYSSLRHVISAALPGMSAPRRMAVCAGLVRMRERLRPNSRDQEGATGVHSRRGRGDRALDYDVVADDMQLLDVDFELGRVRQISGEPRQAINHYLASIASFGKNRETCFNLGICCIRLSQPGHARAWFMKAIECARDVDDEYALATTWLEHCEVQLGNAAATPAQQGCSVEGGLRPTRLVSLPSGRKVYGLDG